MSLGNANANANANADADADAKTVNSTTNGANSNSAGAVNFDTDMNVPSDFEDEEAPLAGTNAVPDNGTHVPQAENRDDTLDEDGLDSASAFHACIIEHLDDLRAQLVNPVNNGSTHQAQNIYRSSSTSHPGNHAANHTSSTINPSHIHLRNRRNILRNIFGFQQRLTSLTYHPGKSYPKDCYTLIALYGPENRHWPLRHLAIFMFGMIVFLFQVLFLLLLVWSEVDKINGTAGDNDNPGEKGFSGFIPAGASPIVRTTQIVSLLAYVLFPESNLQDLIKAVQLLPRSLNEPDYSTWRVAFSCFIRIFKSIIGIIAVWILVMASDTVIAIILNFAAINFISELDELAFSLAEAGVFGHALKTEIVQHIMKLKLPKKHHAKPMHYWIGMGIAFAMIFSMMSVVMSKQISDKKWTTEVLRMELRDQDFHGYSGCFKLNGSFHGRPIYNNFGDANKKNSSIGYCRQERKWVFYDNQFHNITPCDATDRNALSPSTDTFDISSSFEESASWVTSSNAPLDWFVFESGTPEEKLYCDLSLADGICNVVFNLPEYDFDQGDCCAPTCSQDNCGQENSTTVFQSALYPELSFPNCNDTAMVPITIQLNAFTSSRNEMYDDFYQFLDPETRGTLGGPWIAYNETEIKWRSETPLMPLFTLNCNGKDILRTRVNKSMLNGLEIVMVEDGAICEVVVESSEDSRLPWDSYPQQFYVIPPIWNIEYSIYHGSKEFQNDKHIEIFRKENSQKGSRNFTRIPECYVQKLGDRINITTIYVNEAAKLLLREDNGKNECEEDPNFEERFAIATFFQNGLQDNLSFTKNYCLWPVLDCRGGKVTEIKVGYESNHGTIPTEVSILSDLEAIELSGQNLRGSIPSEMAMLSNLSFMFIESTFFTGSIHAEIWTMKNLQSLVADFNQNLTGSIPSEIGMLTNLSELYLRFNAFTGSIPSEIGMLTNLSRFFFDNNEFTGSIPSEIGMLTKLSRLFFDNNNFTGSIPSEIGMLTNLPVLHVNTNAFTGSIPREIGMLTNLSELYLYDNEFTGSIPSEMGMLTNLSELYLNTNAFTGSIPSEIGMLTNLSGLAHNDNEFTGSIPSEIGMLINLSGLALNDNAFTGSIPSEIGMLTNLSELYLCDNAFTGSVPSEIGMLTNLSKSCLDTNAFAGSVPTQTRTSFLPTTTPHPTQTLFEKNNEFEV